MTLTTEYVVDSVGLIFRLNNNRTLGQAAKDIFAAAEAGRTIIYIPGMCFAEVLLAFEKKRINFSLDDLEAFLQRFPNYKQYPLDLAVTQKAAEISDLPELHDRLMAGTARLLNVPIITNDLKMRASSFVQTVW